MKNTKKRGFTIVELVIVIAVIAILAAVLIPTFSNVIDSAKKSSALQEARNAWTNYLAGQGKEIDASETLVIHHGGYCFTVENGKSAKVQNSPTTPIPKLLATTTKSKTAPSQSSRLPDRIL